MTLSSEHAINGKHCFLGVHISGSKNTHILMNIVLDTRVVVVTLVLFISTTVYLGMCLSQTYMSTQIYGCATKYV